jgi:hypothetical protein
MARLIVAIALALLLGQALAPAASAGVELCTATCSDDGPDGQCAASCLDCGCCSHGVRNPMARQDSPNPPAETARCSAADTGAGLPKAFQKDVFHVPKSDLA